LRLRLIATAPSVRKRESEDIAYYQGFVKHLGNSSPVLPQLAAARTVLGRLMLSKRGKLLLSDEFFGDMLEPGWEDAGKPGVLAAM